MKQATPFSDFTYFMVCLSETHPLSVVALTLLFFSRFSLICSEVCISPLRWHVVNLLLH